MIFASVKVWLIKNQACVIGQTCPIVLCFSPFPPTRPNKEKEYLNALLTAVQIFYRLIFSKHAYCMILRLLEFLHYTFFIYLSLVFIYVTWIKFCYIFFKLFISESLILQIVSWTHVYPIIRQKVKLFISESRLLQIISWIHAYPIIRQNG